MPEFLRYSVLLKSRGVSRGRFEAVLVPGPLDRFGNHISFARVSLVGLRRPDEGVCQSSKADQVVILAQSLVVCQG